MCSNYEPVTSEDRMLAHFGVVRPKGEIPIDSYPGYLAPLIRRAPNVAEQESEAKLGRYGLLPAWAKDMALGRRTYNCRSETAATLPSFRDAWRRGQRCIVPAEAIYEPSYETGRAVRWRIGRRDGRPLGIAGLWDWWTNRATGEAVLSFTMLTVNADDHALMKRFHKPGEEKRMVVILDEDEYDAWLDCPVDHMAGFMRQFPADRLEAMPWPRDMRGGMGVPGGATGELF